MRSCDTMATKLHPLVALPASLVVLGLALYAGQIDSSIIDFTQLPENAVNLVKLAGVFLSMYILALGGIPEDE